MRVVDYQEATLPLTGAHLAAPRSFKSAIDCLHYCRPGACGRLLETQPRAGHTHTRTHKHTHTHIHTMQPCRTCRFPGAPPRACRAPLLIAPTPHRRRRLLGHKPGLPELDVWMAYDSMKQRRVAPVASRDAQTDLPCTRVKPFM